MDLEQIRELLKIVAESAVSEIEVEEEGFRLVVRKNAPSVTVQPTAPPMPFGLPYPPPVYGNAAPPPPVAPPAAPAPAPPAAESEPAAAPPPARSDKDVEVRAPIVGTFYLAPAPDADPYVQVGDTVKPGDVLCIIEAMKLMNEIESEVAGTVRKVLSENASPVEYDQPLFVIETG